MELSVAVRLGVMVRVMVRLEEAVMEPERVFEGVWLRVELIVPVAV